MNGIYIYKVYMVFIYIDRLIDGICICYIYIYIYGKC